MANISIAASASRASSRSCRGQGRSPATERIVREEECRRNCSFTYELAKSALVDALGHPRVDADAADVGQASEDAGEISGGWAVARVAQPRERGHPTFLIGDQQSVEGADLPWRECGHHDVGRELARLALPAIPIRSMRLAPEDDAACAKVSPTCP